MAVRPTFATVDLANVAHNVRAIASFVAPARLLAVVKADAYGHGAVRVLPAMLAAGAWGGAVALLEEAVDLRKAGVRAPLVVLGGIYPGFEDLSVRHDLSVVVWEVAQIERLADAALRGPGRPVRIHVKVDTGMARLGARLEELDPILGAIAHAPAGSLLLEGLMTHFACADDEDRSVLDAQLARFAAARERVSAAGFEPELVHAANSAALLRERRSHFSAVRPGLILHGVSPRVGADELAESVGLALRPTLRWTSRIFGLRALPAGTGVSYGHLDTLAHDAVVAIVPVGYEDGYPRATCAPASVIVGGRRCRIVGAITMDTMLVDVTGVANVAIGHEVTLVGGDGAEAITVGHLAAWSGRLRHEILCGLSLRVPRV